MFTEVARIEFISLLRSSLFLAGTLDRHLPFLPKSYNVAIIVRKVSEVIASAV